MGAVTQRRRGIVVDPVRLARPREHFVLTWNNTGAELREARTGLSRSIPVDALDPGGDGRPLRRALRELARDRRRAEGWRGLLRRRRDGLAMFVTSWSWMIGRATGPVCWTGPAVALYLAAAPADADERARLVRRLTRAVERAGAYHVEEWHGAPPTGPEVLAFWEPLPGGAIE